MYAYLNGEILAEQRVAVSPGESRLVILKLKTVYFEYVHIVQTPKFLQAIVTLKNLYRPLPNATLTMEVFRDGNKIAVVRVAAYDILPVGRIENLAVYTSPSGLKPGKYVVRLILFSNGQAVATAKTHVMVKAEPQAPVLGLMVLAAIVILLPFIQKYIRDSKETFHARRKTASSSQS